jgi:hypothetical protein
MAQDVVLERISNHGEGAPPTRGSQSKHDVDRVTGVMAEDVFWRAIALLDWNASEPSLIIEPLVKHLSELSSEEIAGFQRVLSHKLSQLDGERFAREIGQQAYGVAEAFSEDHFLDVRAAAVANGRGFFEGVLEDPSEMPKDREFEALLTVAEEAYRRKTGRTPLFLGAKNVETFSNEEGWE